MNIEKGKIHMTTRQRILMTHYSKYALNMTYINHFMLEFKLQPVKIHYLKKFKKNPARARVL